MLNTTPIKPSNVQIAQLKENENFEIIKTVSKDNKVYNSPVPPGITAKIASNDNAEALETTVAPKISEEKLEEFAKTLNNEVKAAPTEGLVDDSGHIAPIAGGYIDMKTAIYIAPPPKSLFDHNTGLYVPPPNYGTVDTKGGYQPPEGLKLTPSGEFVPDSQNRENKNLVPSTQEDASLNLNKTPVLMPLSVPMTDANATRDVATTTTTPTNDVLGGGFFIPGNYFIDVRPPVNNDPPPVNESANVRINVIQ